MGRLRLRLLLVALLSGGLFLSACVVHTGPSRSRHGVHKSEKHKKHKHKKHKQPKKRDHRR